MSPRAIPIALPSVPSDAESSLAAAWRFFCAGDPAALRTVEVAWQQAQGRPVLQAEIAATAVLFIENLFITLVDLPRWSDRLDADRSNAAQESTPEVQLLVEAAEATLEVRDVRRPGKARSPIDAWVQRLDAVADPNRAVLATASFMLHADVFSDDAGFAKVEVAAGALVPAAEPYVRFIWHVARAQHASYLLQHDEADRLVDDAERSVRANPGAVATADRMQGAAAIAARQAAVLRSWFAISRGDTIMASAALAPLEASDLKRPDAVAGWTEVIRARIATRERRYAAAKRHAHLANAIGAKVGLNIRAGALQIEVQVMTAIGEGAEAAAILEREAAEMSGNLRDSALGAAGLCRSYVALRRGDAETARAELGPALDMALRLDSRGFFLFVPHIAAELLAAALHFNIHRDWVRHVIRERMLPAPAGAPADWPWLVRIRALGGFAVDVDGAAADGDSRARGKPVEALRAIVAHGGSRVPLDRLLATVWRGKGRVGAENAGYVTLHRLRKLLGADDALLLVDGQLSLAPEFVWIDLWALDAALAQARDGDAAASARAVIATYTGPLLGNAAEPWAVDARDRLRARVAAACIRGLDAMPDDEAEALRRHARLADPELKLPRGRA